MIRKVLLLAIAVVLTAVAAFGAGDFGKRKIIIDQDAAGPVGSDQQAMMVLIQSSQTDVLGITVVTGDQWLKAELAHTLRMLEIIGRSDIPVVAGAEYPLVRTQAETEMWERRFGTVGWLGAWQPKLFHPADELGDMPEGKPTTKPIDEDAAHFLVRMVRKYPHEVTIYAGGPMTNLALAISIDPEFPKLAKELIFMGASLNPVTDNPEFANTPRHEFNLWFDPEASHIVLRAPWKKIVCTTVDISLKTHMTRELVARVAAGNSAAAHYVRDFTKLQGDVNYLWDELASAAWLDPSIITKKQTLYMDIDLARGASYGNVLTWSDHDKPKVEVQPVEIQVDLDEKKFYDLFVKLMSGPTPGANSH